MTLLRAVPTSVHLQQGSPLRPPDWRWQKAKLLYDNRRPKSRRKDDNGVARAYEFIRNLASANTDIDHLNLADAWCSVYQAYAIWTDQTSYMRSELEARLLTGEGIELVAGRMGLDAPIVLEFESLFFNVLDRIQNPSWVVQRVIPKMAQENLRESNLDTVWKIVAYSGGVHALEPFLYFTTQTTKPDNPEGVATFLAEQSKSAWNRKRFVNALAVRPVDVYSRIQLEEIGLKYDELSQAAGITNTDFSNQVAGCIKALAIGVGKEGRAGDRVRPAGAAAVNDTGAVEYRASELALVSHPGELPDLPELKYPNKEVRLETTPDVE